LYQVQHISVSFPQKQPTALHCYCMLMPSSQFDTVLIRGHL